MKKFLSFVLVLCFALPLVSTKVSFVALGFASPPASSEQNSSEKNEEAKESLFAQMFTTLNGLCTRFGDQTCTEKAQQVKDAACLGWNNVKNVSNCIFGDENTGCENVMNEAKKSKWAFGVVFGLAGLGAVTVLLNLLQLIVG